MKDSDVSSTNLRRIRHSKGWSQAELADNADVSHMLIYRWENKGQVPNGKKVKQVADALGVPTSYIFQTFADSPTAPGHSPIKRTLVSNINDRLLSLDERDLRAILTLAESLRGDLKNA